MYTFNGAVPDLCNGAVSEKTPQIFYLRCPLGRVCEGIMRHEIWVLCNSVVKCGTLMKLGVSNTC